jgi:hypothetical protein
VGQRFESSQADHTALKYMVGVAQLVEHRIVAPVVEGSIPFAHPKFSRAPVAQLDRAIASGAIGHGFESRRAYHNQYMKEPPISGGSFMY